VSATLAQVFEAFGAEYLDAHGVSAPQAKAWRAVRNCRTAVLGGHGLECDDCGHREYVFHSCRNRHCPTCQTRAKEAWTQDRIAELLPVPYAHLVFTLPHALNDLAAAHDRWVYDTLMATVAESLFEFAKNRRWLGAEPAFTLVLHTWTQDLRRHVHVHVLIACGGLDPAGNWVEPQRNPRFLFPVHALSRVFRAKFLDRLEAAHRSGTLPRDPAAQPTRWAERRQALLKHDWVVYAKTPLGGPAQTLEYLSRYTHRTAVSNERIVAIRDGQVLLRVRADDHGGQRVIRIPGPTFIGRFLQHVLPPGFKRIRHYGLLSPARKQERLTAARTALHVPQPSPPAIEAAADFMRRVAQRDITRCPCCAHGTLRVVAVLLPDRSAVIRPHPALAPPSTCRGPP
jgi:Putative transposase/Transposase zinc-binding domain